MNLLENGSFEGNWTRKTHTGQEFGEIFVPEGWVAFWREGGPVPHDPENDKGYGRPEMHVINREPPFLDPPRVRTGNRALKFFTFHRIHDAGVYQRADVTPGERYRATGWAHAWSSIDDDPHTSNVDGDGARNVTFRVGIDPTGGTDPWADTVVWGDGAHLYNVYGQIPPLEVEARADAVTVFVRSSVLWPFKHCDAYVDDVSLEPVTSPTPPPEEEPGEPVQPGRRIVCPGLHLTTGDSGATDEIRALQAQLQREFPDATLEEIASALPPIKVYGTPELAETLRLFKEINPHLHTTFRLSSVPGSGVNVEGPAFGPDPVAQANGYMNVVLEAMTPYLAWIDLLELWNEQDPVGVAGHVELAQFAQQTILRAAARGVRVGVMSYSLGVPEWDEMQAVVATGLLETAAEHGAVLCLHEYDSPLDKDFGSEKGRLPGYDGDVTDKGPVTFRYRYWLQLARERGAPVQIALTELNTAYDLSRMTAAEWQAQMRWYLSEAAKDDEIVAAHLFGWGSLGGAWHGFDVRQVQTYWRALALDAARGILGQPPAPPADEVPGAYDRYVIVADPTYMTPAQLDAAFARGRAELRDTMISWQSAVQKATEKPAEWRSNTVDAGPMPADLREEYIAWARRRDPDTVLVFGDLPPQGGDDLTIVDVTERLATNPQSPWYPWRQRSLDAITHVFVHHSAGPAADDLVAVHNIVRYHTSPTGKNRPGICYAYVIGSDGTVWQTSDLHDVVFGQGSRSYPGDENYWGLAVCLLGNFVNRPVPEAQYQALQRLIAHLEGLLGHELQVWGHKDVDNTACPGTWWPPVDTGWGRYPAETGMQTRIAINDPWNRGAADWMVAHGVRGAVIVPVALSGAAAEFDFTRYAKAGIEVGVRIGWGWSRDCGGIGTIPPYASSAWHTFVNAVAQTINASRGVSWWVLGNEINNPREWPADSVVTPQQFAYTYNAIWHQVIDARIAPGALDPYHASAGDPRWWWHGIWENIDGADFVDTHGYVRGPDPALVGSDVRFTDEPMTWQSLNFPGCVTSLLNLLPERYRGLPVHTTEFSHLWRDGGEHPDNYGWVDDERAAEVVRRGHAAAQRAGIRLLAAYRWTDDPWAMHDKAHVLNAIRALG